MVISVTCSLVKFSPRLTKKYVVICEEKLKHFIRSHLGQPLDLLNDYELDTFKVAFVHDLYIIQL